MQICGNANGWFFCYDPSGEEGWLPHWVFEDLEESDMDALEPPQLMYGRGRLQGLGVVDRILAKTSGYVDSITFYMKDGREYRYGRDGGHRDAEVMIYKDERIVSVLQREKQSLGEIVLTTSERQLVFKGYFGPGKHFKENSFKCQPGQQIDHFEMQESVLCGIHEVPVPFGEHSRSNELRLRPNKSSRWMRMNE